MTEHSGSDFALPVEDARKQLLARIEEITDYPHGEIFAWEIDCVEVAVRAKTLPKVCERVAEVERNQDMLARVFDADGQLDRLTARAEAASATQHTPTPRLPTT